MNLSDYLDTLDRAAKEAFAERAGTTIEYLQQLKGSHRKPSVELSRKFVEASNGVVTLAGCRPDIWPSETAVA